MIRCFFTTLLLFIRFICYYIKFFSIKAFQNRHIYVYKIRIYQTFPHRLIFETVHYYWQTLAWIGNEKMCRGFFLIFIRFDLIWTNSIRSGLNRCQIRPYPDRRSGFRSCSPRNFSIQTENKILNKLPSVSQIWAIHNCLWWVGFWLELIFLILAQLPHKWCLIQKCLKWSRK